MKTFIILVLLGLTTQLIYAQYLSGYEKDIQGEILRYECQQPDADSSLLVRSLHADKYIEWWTQPVPSTYQDSFAEFVMITGIDVNAEEAHLFNMLVDDELCFTFSNPSDTTVKKWTLKADNGMSLHFKGTMIDKYGDLFGYMFLKIPDSYLFPGKRFKIKVVGESAQSRSWFMVFRYHTGEMVKFEQEYAKINHADGPKQSIRVNMLHFDLPKDVEISIGETVFNAELHLGYNSFQIHIPAITNDTLLDAVVRIQGAIVANDQIVVYPVKHYDVYLLPHSHVDIGYTHVQAEVEQLQYENIANALQYASDTEGNKPGEQFRWNVEVMWAVEAFMSHATEDEQLLFFEGVEKGWIDLNGMYGNILTGLCSAEELFRIFELAENVAMQSNIKLKSAMFSDIPGFAWSMIPAMASFGIRYFSIGTNTFHRIGDIIEKNGDHPFYYLSPSGEDSVLCWIHGKGYSEFHTGLGYNILYYKLKERSILTYIAELEVTDYPYDMIPMRYNIGSDNGPPDPQLCDIVSKWNEKYITPRLHISTVTETFSEFEQRFGTKIPVQQGELSGYWEDGAFSSTKETMLAARAAHQLEQAEVLYSLFTHEKYPSSLIDSAWRNVLLYHEHTWGAWNSISEPDELFVTQQWDVKKEFAEKATRAAEDLLYNAIERDWAETVRSMDVYNTLSWIRSDLVIIPRSNYMRGDPVTDEDGNVVPSQRLSTGELCFVAENIPGFGVKRYHFDREEKPVTSWEYQLDKKGFKDERTWLKTDPSTGEIIAWTSKFWGADVEMISKGLNKYVYIKGRNPEELLSNHAPFSKIKEEGDVLVSLIMESDAPGSVFMTRELIFYKDLNHIDICNVLNKTNVREPEAVLFGFPFNIPEGELTGGLALADFNPFTDQLPGACKNYFPVKNYIDISNDDWGVTLTTPELNMFQVGKIRTDAHEVGFVDSLPYSQDLYAYVMNNYWETNYKADQGGVSTFKFSLYPHQGNDPVMAFKSGMESSHSLLIYPSAPFKVKQLSPVEIESEWVVVTECRMIAPQTLLIRLFNPADHPGGCKILIDEKRLGKANCVEEKIDVTQSFIIPAKGIRTITFDYL